jgi:hypothetical protein
MSNEPEPAQTAERQPRPRRGSVTLRYWEDELMDYAWASPAQAEETVQSAREPIESRQLATSDF